MQGGVRYDEGVDGTPTWNTHQVGWEGWGGPCRGGEEMLVLCKLTSWSVLQDLVPDVG